LENSVFGDRQERARSHARRFGAGEALLKVVDGNAGW
jgi:hypothetical protein